MTDGYINESILQKYSAMEDLLNHQSEVNKNISNLSKEISQLPELPRNLEEWTDSLSNIYSEDKTFKLSDFKRVFKINKEYCELIEKREKNLRQIKMLTIDSVIDRIKNVLDKK